jgi:hypothetical protein
MELMNKALKGMLKQAQKMSEQIAKIQEELGKKTVTASSGGGMVSVIVNGHQEILDVKIDQEVIDPKDPEMLQDLVLTAINEGLRKSREMIADEMKSVAGGLGLPNIPGLI